MPRSDALRGILDTSTLLLLALIDESTVKHPGSRRDSDP